jgi:mono/diheme cytochrome c family protein
MRSVFALLLCALALSVGSAVAEEARISRALPTRLNPPPAASPSDTPSLTQPVIPHSLESHPAANQVPETVLAWDSGVKEYAAKMGEVEGRFSFSVTNVSAEEVVIHSVSTSCGCTVAQLPQVPWVLAPGSNGQINATMNLAGKVGNITKVLTVNTDKGQRNLLVRAMIPVPEMKRVTGPVPLRGVRENNQELAKIDRQAVFRDDCAKCHAEPAKDKLGHELYTGVCGVCHDAEHRAAAVPDLRALKHETNVDYWKEWIKNGKEGTMMPAFAAAKGGPLSDDQVQSLVDYLSKMIVSQQSGSVSKEGQPSGQGRN